MGIKHQQFSLDTMGDYIHLRTWGELDVNDLEAPADAALKLAKAEKIDKLLDDIRDVDTSGVNIAIQAKAMGILWELRHFKKVAIVLKGAGLRNLFFSALDALHLSGATFKGFENEAEAIEWLRST